MKRLFNLLGLWSDCDLHQLDPPTQKNGRPCLCPSRVHAISEKALQLRQCLCEELHAQLAESVGE